MSFLTSARPIIRGALPSMARSLSKITLVGRLAATPELITTSNGREIVRYAVGTSTGYGENKVTSWWKVASFAPEGPLRDNMLKLGKGSMLYVEGDASMRKFERDGRTETGLSLVQTKYDVLDRRESSGEDAQGEIIEEQ